MRNERWQRALDLQMDYWKWCNLDEGAMYNASYFLDVLDRVTSQARPDLDQKERLIPHTLNITKHFMSSLWRADTMYVTADMLHLMMQAAHDLPEDVVFDEHTLITRCGFCLFEEPLFGTDRSGSTVLIHGFLWDLQVVMMTDDEYVMAFPEEQLGERTRTIMLYFLCDPHDSRDEYNADFVDAFRKMGVPSPPMSVQHFYPCRLGRRLPEVNGEPGQDIIAEAVKLFVAMQLLGQQKIGQPIQMRPDRATRRRIHREYGQNERLITLITLRRKNVKHDNEEPAKVEWSRRWAVKGHWRHQYYSKTDSHDWVYIHEYIKGPEDKPLILSERRIFNFRR